MIGFCMKCNTGLKWVNDQCHRMEKITLAGFILINGSIKFQLNSLTKYVLENYCFFVIILVF